MSDVTTPRVVVFPQVIDITDSTGFQFDRLSSPEQKCIVESMSGGGHLGVSRRRPSRRRYRRNPRAICGQQSMHH